LVYQKSRVVISNFNSQRIEINILFHPLKKSLKLLFCCSIMLSHLLYFSFLQIVQMLLQTGNRIEKPHEFHCECNECKNRFKFDSLRHAQSRLNAFRGLCSESYISLASVDPILTAFELGHELRYLAEKEKYFKVSLRHIFLLVDFTPSQLYTKNWNVFF